MRQQPQYCLYQGSHLFNVQILFVLCLKRNTLITTLAFVLYNPSHCNDIFYLFMCHFSNRTIAINCLSCRGLWSFVENCSIIMSMHYRSTKWKFVFILT